MRLHAQELHGKLPEKILVTLEFYPIRRGELRDTELRKGRTSVGEFPKPAIQIGVCEGFFGDLVSQRVPVVVGREF